MLRNDIYERDVFEYEEIGTKGLFGEDETLDIRGLSCETIPSCIMEAYEDYRNSFAEM